MQLYRQMRKASTPVLVLSLLAEQLMYGYQIALELEQRSEGYFTMKEDLLYPALHRMERDDLLSSEWRTVAGARRRKYYFITEKGQPIHVPLKCQGSPHIYAMEDGQKRWIKDIPTFEAGGCVWEDVKFVSCDYLRSLPDGPPIPEDAGPPPQP
jgi:hypothetical protein